MTVLEYDIYQYVLYVLNYRYPVYDTTGRAVFCWYVVYKYIVGNPKCSHINSSPRNNAVGGHRSNNFGVEDYLRIKRIKNNKT